MSPNTLIVLPLVIPLATAAACLMSWRFRLVQRVISVTGAMALLAAALVLLQTVRREGFLVTQMGSWPAPYGITLVVDVFSSIMVVLAALMGAAVIVYSMGSIDARREAYGYYPFLHFLLMGVSGVFLTGDLFNLYVWFEVMLMASFVMLALGGEKAQLEGAIKYVTLNLLSSAFFLTALGILYGMAGTLNMADLARRLGTLEHPDTVVVLAMLFLVAFGIKSAIFPFFFWLPASYHTPPVPVSALFAGLLTKVGVYTLLRIFTLLFVQDVDYTHTLILILAGLTMVVGVLGAMSHNEFRRILSFHIISQVGYMIMGLGLYTSMAVAGAIFYIIHHIIVKTNLFLVSGVAHQLQGSFALNALGGLSTKAPWLTAVFAVAAFSLAGIPPLSGFWAKLILIRAGLEIESYLIAGTALGVGLLTLFSMAKIWSGAFWGDAPSGVAPAGRSNEGGLSLSSKTALYLPMFALALLTLAIGLMSEPFMALSRQAADQLLHPAGYIGAVLEGTP